MQKSMRTLSITSIALLAAVAMTGCSTASNSGNTTTTTSTSSSAPAVTTSSSSQAPAGPTWLAPKKDGPYKVALANSFTANTWRTQVNQEFQNACDNTYKDKITCLAVADGNGDTPTQISQISNFITQGVNLILIDANDVAALNPVIQQAQQAGIQVVDFDSNTSSPYAIHVVEDQQKIGELGAQWLIGQLKSGDKIISMDGIQGNPTSDARQKGADQAFAAAGITIVGRADTKWDKATAQTAAATLLAQHGSEIKAVYSQGGDASLGAIAAMQQLNMKVLPIPGEASNGFLKAWQSLSTSQAGFQSWAFASPPQLVIDALDAGLKALGGTDPSTNGTINLDIPVITADTLAANVKADLNDSLWLPTKLPADFLQQHYAK
ncbi:MAG: substrate-binding domain-containing protein [Actinomycetia bacterium]|nr:substrate-binding domain-containing protein [Actinomycetes bacterium]